MTKPAKHSYEFGPFRLDPAEQQLWRDGDEVSLTPKTFGVLFLMVKNSGHTLQKDDFMKEVWSDSFVEEKNLTDNISILRQALGDTAQEQKYIKTIPKRGYRFVAHVREVQEEGEDLIVAEQSQTHILIEEDIELTGATQDFTKKRLTDGVTAGRVSTRRKLRRVVIAAVCAVIVGCAAYYFWSRKSNTPAEGRPAMRSIAVLPFKPLVANERDESLEMGMADTLITRLGNLREITVRPVSMVRKYTDLQQDAVAAGRELSVEFVLDGSIQRQGDRIRVTVRLVNVTDGAQVWAKKFDEEFTDIFGVQDSISQQVALALVPRLTGEDRQRLAKRYTDNTEAYNLYLKGRFFWNKFNEEGLKKAIDYFNQAIAIDPEYALAYAGLSVAYNVQGGFGMVPPAAVWTKAKSSAEKAVELDDTLAEAHSALGAVKLFFEWDGQGAEKELKLAIELRSNYAEPHQLISFYLGSKGRTQEALAEMKRALELEPLSPAVNMDMSQSFYWSRRYDEALVQYRKAEELDPHYLGPLYYPGQMYERKGEFDRAIAECQKAFSIFGRDPAILSVLGFTYAVSGKRREAQKILAELAALWKRRYFSPVDIALVYTGLGDNNGAFAWLEKAFDARDAQVIFLKVEPQLDGLRSDPRYTDLLRRMNIEP